MPTVTDEQMRERLAGARQYSLIILKHGPNYKAPGADKLIWEHGRRNFELRADGVLSIVCPVNDGSDVSGIGIFKTSPDETKKIMDEDSGVQSGTFVYELHPCRGFPGDALPK